MAQTEQGWSTDQGGRASHAPADPAGQQWVSLPVSEFEALHARIRLLEGEQEHVRALHAAMTTAVHWNEEQRGIQAKEIERLNALNERLRQQGFAAAEKLEPLQAEIERLNAYVGVLDDNVASLQEQVFDRDAEIERLRVLRAECDGWFLDAQTRFATYEAEIERLRIAGHEHDPQSCGVCSGHPFDAGG